MSSDALEATLRRLRLERDAADRRYNDALTELDRTIEPPATLPDAPLALDDHQAQALNEAWNIIPAPPSASWSRRRITGAIWAVVAPYFQRQLSFNSLLVDHLNRNAEAQRAAQRHEQEMVNALRAQIDQVMAFESRLMVLLQQVTAYVDTKDRDAGGGALVLNAAISGLAEAQAKYRESLAAREQRYETRTAALSAAHEELRGLVGLAQQAIVSLKRGVERLGPAAPSAATSSAATPSSNTPSAPAPSAAAFAPSLDAYKYVGFEDQFRGPREVIRERLESYIAYFDGGPGGDVLDVGCGRGEFLDLLAARAIASRGIDLNHEMAESCRARGLKVEEADAVGYLTAIPDNSLGGVFAAQVVEHLEPAYLLRFLELAFEKLQPGGRLVLETLNPACWTAFFESYIRDITHRWPLHPETLKYLVLASGFSRAEIEFRSPVPEQDKLQPIAAGHGAPDTAIDLVETFNANVGKLNDRMFTFMDYAVVATKAGGSR